MSENLYIIDWKEFPKKSSVQKLTNNRTGKTYIRSTSLDEASIEFNRVFPYRKLLTIVKEEKEILPEIPDTLESE